MISMWAMVTEQDLEAYAGTLILPPYLSHLRLGPFRFSDQAANADGREPLRITYLGEGRLEEFTLGLREHALAMIRFVCPGIDASRIQLPQDDAGWTWTTAGDAPHPMRIYFAPTAQALNAAAGRPAREEAAYVSVSRGHVFIAPSVVESYLRAWLDRLRIGHEIASLDFGTPSGGIEFVAGAVGGEMLLDDDTAARDLVRFAGLDAALAEVSNFVELDLDSAAAGHCGVLEDGVYLLLPPASERSRK